MTVLEWVWNGFAVFGILTTVAMISHLWETQWQLHSIDGNLMHVLVRPHLFAKHQLRTVVDDGPEDADYIDRTLFWQDTGQEVSWDDKFTLESFLLELDAKDRRERGGRLIESAAKQLAGD